MTPEQWHRVKEVFEQALEHEAGERSAFVGQACASDALLHSEVNSLLSSYEEESGFMETPAAALAAQSLSKAESAALVGQPIGHYQIIRELGRGGMGVVYLAQDISLGRPVALKLLPAQLTGDPDRLRRFEREARAASALNHPNILTIHQIGQLDGLHFIATEFIEGVTLREQMKNQALELSKALNEAMQIANALSAAHKAGIVHRDIKPENIMLRPDGYVKVLDFGLAKLTERQVISTETELGTLATANTDTGVVIGTAGYMSPEQAKGQRVDQRSDIFSFGAVFYEMLTGEMAFRRDSDVDTLHAIIHDDPVGLSGLREKVPTAVEEVLLRCLEKEPDDRYRTGADLAAALEAAMVPSQSILTPTAPLPDGIGGAKVIGKAAHDFGPQTKEVQPGRSTLSPASSKRRPLFWTVGVLGGLMLIAAGAWYFSRLLTKPGSTQIALTTNPLTTNPGFEGMPSLSPDGTYVAFGSFGEKFDNLDIYVKLIGGDGPPLRLTSDPAVDMCPAWSPDGRWIAFIRDRDDRNEVLLIPAIGGSERKLGRTTNDLPWPLSDSPYLSWSADGKYLVTEDRASPAEPPGLFVLSVATGERRRLITPPAPALFDGHPAVSPDGRMLAFVRSISYGNTDLYVLPLTADCQPAGEARHLDLPQPWVTSPAWTADGQYIVCEAGLPWAQRAMLWRVSVSGSEKPVSLALGEGTYEPTISRQGNRLVYQRWGGTAPTPIWRAEVSGRDKLRPPVQLVSSSRMESGPVYSPDGSRIVFSSTRSGNSEIWMCNGDGSNPIQLTSLQSTAYNPRWFPDGKRIVFDSMIDKQAEIYVIDTDTRVPRRLTYDPSDDGIPSVSHDGKWIYFAPDRTGRGEVWRLPAEGGEAVQLTHEGGSVPLESPDGKVVYYSKWTGETSEVWKVPVAGGEETRVLGPALNFAVVADGIYFFEAPPTNRYASWIYKNRLKFFSFARGTTEQVFEIKGWLHQGLSVSPDGRYVLFTRFDFFEADLMLVEDFH